MVVENEYEPGATLEGECLERLSNTVRSDGEHTGGKVSVVFGLRSPVEFKECAHAEEADGCTKVSNNAASVLFQPNPSPSRRVKLNRYLSPDGLGSPSARSGQIDS